jgi:glycosyltransferase involved in cell wall biosynthesis
VPVALDIQGVQSRAHAERGIARYLIELAAALEQYDIDRVARYLLNRDLPIPAVVEPLTRSGKLGFTDEQLDATLYHIGSPFELGIPLDQIWPRFARRGMRLVVTLYDLIPRLFPALYLADSQERRRYETRLELVRRADRILAISEATAADAIGELRLADEKVAVVGTGVSERFRPAADRVATLETLRSELRWLEPDFVLFTGGIEPRKNVDRLLVAYSGLPELLRRRHQLVVVCRVSADQRTALRTRLRELGISARVHFPGYLPDEQLIMLYQSATLVVFPSIYEGFGLPVAEAIACGAPAIAARNSSLVELVRDERAQFEAHDTRSIRGALERFLSDEGLRSELAAVRLDSRHTWPDVAKRTAAVYEELERRDRRPWKRPRRIAFVSPLPPQRSGVADESYRLVSALTDHCEVDVFVDGEAPSITSPPRAEVKPLSQLEAIEAARGGYDRVVYCFGNSEFHAGALAMLRRRPGVVLAHDVRLTGLYWMCSLFRPDLEPRGFYDTLHAMYPGLAPELGRDGGISFEDADRHGVYMAKEVLELAEMYLVHSRHAATLARLDANPGDERKIRVLPYATISPDEFRVRELSSSQELIATFGMVAPTKQVLKLIDTFAHVHSRHTEAILAIVGAAPGDYGEDVRARPRQLALERVVRLTGFVGERRFHAWLEHASLAVQLRGQSNGESSAVVARCLAAGVPTIVTNLGSAAELPDDCVIKVARDVTPDALADAIVALLRDRSRRQELRKRSLEYARDHSFERVAKLFYEAVVLEQTPLTGLSS